MKYRLKSGSSLLALTAALGANTATAADLPLKGNSAPPVVYESWTGPYVGLSIGGAFDNYTETNLNNAFTGAPSKAPSADLSSSNPVVGVHAGFNYQIGGSWVVGVEGDLSGLPFQKTRFAPDATGGNVEGNLSGLASLRGRIGLVFDRTLVYATGGWGWVGENLSYHSFPGNNQRFSSNADEPVVGGGFEYKVTQSLTAGVEGLFFLNNRTTAFTSSTGRTYNFGSGTVGVVRARVSYNW